MFKSAPPGEFNEILIVDDDLDTREILADLLQHRGYSTASVADGREALDFLRTYHPPRVILLDMKMPTMDGWEFMEHQTRDPELTDIPVIVFSATIWGQPAGASAVLPKPVQIDAVIELIQQFIPDSQNSASPNRQSHKSES